jgi:hypothetical protein
MGLEAHQRGSLRNGASSGHEGREDVDITRGSVPREGAPEVCVPHVRSPAAAGHSSRPSIGIS